MFSTLLWFRINTIPQIDKIIYEYITMKAPSAEPYHQEVRSCPTRCVPAQPTIHLWTKLGKTWYMPSLIGVRTWEFLILRQPFVFGAKIAIHVMQLQCFILLTHMTHAVHLEIWAFIPLPKPMDSSIIFFFPHWIRSEFQTETNYGTQPLANA